MRIGLPVWPTTHGRSRPATLASTIAASAETRSTGYFPFGEQPPSTIAPATASAPAVITVFWYGMLRILRGLRDGTAKPQLLARPRARRQAAVRHSRPGPAPC